MKKSKVKETLKIEVLNIIRNHRKDYPIQSKELCTRLNIPFRILKEVITELRESIPIVSKETNGGGYWIAESDEEILDYINMINARKQGYEETINKMKKLLVEGS